MSRSPEVPPKVHPKGRWYYLVTYESATKRHIWTKLTLIAAGIPALYRKLADMKAAEVAQLLRDGVKITINSDDPAYFGGYVADNYAAVAAKAGLTSEEVVTLAKNSFEASWIDEDRRAAYLAEIDRYVEQYEPTEA